MTKEIRLSKNKQRLYETCRKVYGNLCVDPLKRRHERHYQESPLHLAFDIIMVTVVAVLIAGNIFLWWGGGRDYVEKIIQQTLPALAPRSAVPAVSVSEELELEIRPTIEAFGQTIGLGPHPPRVGEESTYWIFLRVKPPPAAITNVVVRGALAPGVRWTDNISSGAGSVPTCNEQCEFRWTIGDITVAQDSLFSNFEAAFEVALTPSAIAPEYPLLTYLEIVGKQSERELRTVVKNINTAGL